MKSYVLSAATELDLEAIWEYIADDNIETADSWISRLFDAFEVLENNPRMGHKREDLTPLPILFWPVGAYLVLYRVHGEQVEIVAVAHGARDIPAFLHQRNE